MKVNITLAESLTSRKKYLCINDEFYLTVSKKQFDLGIEVKKEKEE